MLHLTKLGRSVVNRLGPKSVNQKIVAGQIRNQCSSESDNAKVKQQYDEQDSLFSDQELTLFKKLFLKFDRDDNCKLDRWEFNMLAKFMVGRSFNAIDLEKVVRTVDKNKDGWITFPEMMHHFGRRFMPQEKDRITIAFNFFDKDSDGRLEFWETKQALFYLGENVFAKNLRYKFDLTDRDQDGKITYVFSKIDANQDEFISWGETVTYMRRRYSEILRNRALKAFNTFDSDGDGLLGFHQVKSALQSLGKDTSSPFLVHMFAAEDQDKDQKIDFPEFSRLMSAMNTLTKKL